MILAVSPTWAYLVATASALAYLLLALRSAGMGVRLSRGVFALAWLLHALSLAEGLFGQPPRFGFAPALSMTVWLALAVIAIENELLPNLRSGFTLAGVGTVAVLLPQHFPGVSYAAIGSAWLPLHWALGIASYGLFTAAVLHGWLMARSERRLREMTEPPQGMPLLALERLTFRFVQAGFVMLTASLLAGAYFAQTVYDGKAGSLWNHKTAFSVLAWFIFAGLLLGRRLRGWRGRQALRVLYLGAGLLLLGYLGSRFVLEVVLQRG
jgi:ABC-type uncharacterized transport system permease subunit